MSNFNEKNIKKSLISGFLWRFGERIGAQAVSFIVSMILARLLSPDEFGAIALVMTFISIANVFVTSGFGNSLIQKNNADNLDFSSVFYFNILLSIILYAIIFMISPSIARYYNMNILSLVLRVLGLRIILAGINSVQQAFVSRNMLFKKFFFSTLIGTIVSGVVGIIMAFSNFGIWALVGQYLINSLMDTIILWFTVKWRPSLCFSLERMKSLFSYGWKLLCSGLLFQICNELSNLIIGKAYSATDLAFFSKGKQLPNLIVTNINTSISGVLFPALSKFQNDKDKILVYTRKSIKMSSYIMSPLILGLFAIAEPIIIVLFTEKWLFCVPYLRLYCIYYLLQPMQTANLEAIKAMGRSDLYLKLEVIKRSSAFLILLLSMRYGVIAIAIGEVLASFIRSVINAYPNQRILGYNYFMQLKDMSSAIILAIIMAVVVYSMNYLNVSILILLPMQIFIGIVTYVGMSILFKVESFYTVINLGKELKQKKVA